MERELLPARLSGIDAKYTKIARTLEYREDEVSSIISSAINVDIGPYVYHYTNIESALNILSSEELWATDVNDLNDDKEWGFFYETLDYFLSEMESRYRITDYNKNDPEIAISAFFAGFMRRGGQWQKPTKTTDNYVVSFSYEPDSFKLWDDYADQDRGVCLVLDRIFLEKGRNVFGGVVKTGMVRYGRDQTMHILKAVFDACISFIKLNKNINTHSEDVLMEWASRRFFVNLLGHSGHFKKFEYGEEKEWRLWVRRHQNFPDLGSRGEKNERRFVRYSTESLLTEKMTHYVPCRAIILGNKISCEDKRKIEQFTKTDAHLNHIKTYTREKWRISIPIYNVENIK